MLLDSFFTEGLELFALLVMNHCMVIFSLLIERMDVENSHGKGVALVSHCWLGSHALFIGVKRFSPACRCRVASGGSASQAGGVRL